MDAEQLKKLSDILHSESKAEVVKLVQSISSEDELFVLLDNYNWDNGFEVPEAIINHPNCTLSLALLAFIEQMGYDIYLKERMLLQILYRNPGKLLSRKFMIKS